MNKKNKFFLFSFFLFLFACPNTHGIIIGSESAVSVQSAASFPASDTDNTMLGFGWFKNGFALQDATTTCTFNSVYPVSGTVDISGGTLTLLQDLIFHNITALTSMGTVVGNNYALDLCSTITALPSNASTLGNTHIFFHNDLVVTSTITLQGNCSFSGDGNSLIMGENGAIILDSNAQVKFQNMEIKGLHSNNLQCFDDTGRIILNDIVWEQNGDFSFSAGSILMQDMVTFMGTATFTYDSKQTFTIDKNSTFFLTNGISFSTGRNPISGAEPIAFVDSTSVIKLSNCAYDIAPTGMSLTKGTIFFEKNVSAHINSTSFATGITLGSGAPADDFTIYFSPGCSINHYGHMTYNNSVPNLLKSTSDITLLTRHTNSSVLANTNFEMPEITVQLVSSAVPPIAVTPGKSLSFDKTAIILPEVSFKISGLQQNAYTYIMPGNGIINLTKGSLPLLILAQNTGNQILGNGNLSGPIALANSSATLYFNLNGYVGHSLALNGGTITLNNDLMLYNSGIITGPGKVNLTNRILHVNSGLSNWETPIAWQANDGAISIEQKLSLASTWTVQGSCVFDGNNNELEFLENGEIVIDSNSELYLKNLRLQSIADVNIRCVDDTGVLVLDDVYWTQTDDYVFNKGSIRIINEVDLVGSYTFFYESTQTSTIGVKSTLTARDHLNFSIGKQQVPGAQEPLMLEDNSSLIVLDNAQWSIKGDGMRVTNGRAICSDNVLLDIASTNSTQGLKLGDSTQAGDMIFEFRPGATVTMPRGHVVCDWYANDNLKSYSTTAQLIRYAANAFYCNCDINLSNLTIVTEPGAPLVIAPGKTFSYNNCIFDVPGGVYNMNGQFYNAYTNLLSGTNSITMMHGVLPLYTIVAGTENFIDGNGSVTGQIILLDPSAELTWTANGSLANTLSLNGGTLNLGTDLPLANGVLFNGPGTIDISNYSLRFGSQHLNLNTPINFNSTGGQLELKSDLSLASTFTITGTCTIQGNGNSIDLGSTGNLVIDTGSTLLLENISLKNVGNTNIKCIDDSGILVLKEVLWSQPSYDYTFDKGAIIIKNNVLMSGDHVFVYETPQTSTIHSHARLMLDSNFTFSYAPSIASDALIEFIDSTSVLVLHGATLHTTGTGLQLKKGSMLAQGTSHLSSDAKITLGNSQINDEFILNIDLGSQLQVEAGSLNYKNVAVDSFNLMNDLSALYFAPNTTLNLYESITYPKGILRFCANTTLAQAPGKEISGSIDLIGELTTIALTP